MLQNHKPPNTKNEARSPRLEVRSKKSETRSRSFAFSGFWLLASWNYFLLFSFCILLLSSFPLAKTKPDSCVQCHEQLDERLAKPVKRIQEDVHARVGLSCADCHGGDRTKGAQEGDYTLAMDPKKGYVGIPQPKDIPAFCGKCHSQAEFMHQYDAAVHVDQENLYRTSIHGQLNAQGDRKVAHCVSCHGYHGIKKKGDVTAPTFRANIATLCSRCHADAVYMRNYKIPVNQFERYRLSVHGLAFFDKGDVKSAPICIDCHGYHGATPPGLSTVADACGKCHQQNELLFLKSPHKDAFAKRRLPACVACHGNHAVQPTSDALVGTGTNSMCILCHQQDDQGFQEAKRIRSALTELITAIKMTESTITDAERLGRDVTLAKISVQEAKDDLVRARTMVHTFTYARVTETTQPGISATIMAKKVVTDATLDIRYRYVGLVAFLIILTLVSCCLYGKIRELDRNREKKD
jgi:predicted CXXCH cytochrome family protein